MLKKIIIGNWKMNPLTLKEAEKLLKDVLKELPIVRKTDVVVCPPYIYLEKLRSACSHTKKISIGAQDAFYDSAGAYTGEVSASMLDNLGIKYVILGHSERRAMGETNNEINKKIKASLGAGLICILCVGENTRDENHEYYNLVKMQIEECLMGISKNNISKIIIAYEPVWAISTTPDRRDATAEDSREMAIFIRKILSDKFSGEVSAMRIIYGGSVNERDAEEFLKNGGVDGLLPGKASLSAKKFVEIIKIAEKI